MRIVCLGDSLTGPSPGTCYFESYLKWPDLLRVGLEAVFGADCVTVLNQGKAGEVSSGLRAALTERLLAHRPDFAVVWIGANNYANHAPKSAASDALARDLRDIIGQAKTAGIRVLLVQYPVPRAERKERVWTHADMGNDTIAAVALDTSSPVVDLRPAFAEAASRMPLSCLTSPVDGVHLHPGGEVLVARSILSKFRERGWPSAWPRLPDSQAACSRRMDTMNTEASRVF